MSETRTKTVKQAYDALDVTGKGVITLKDLQGKYSVKNHPLYKNGEMTEEQIFMRFLTKFQTGSTHIDQVLHKYRPIPFYDFALFVVLSLFTAGSPMQAECISKSAQLSTCIFI